MCKFKDCINLKQVFCKPCGLKDHQWKSHGFNPLAVHIKSLQELIEPDSDKFHVKSSYVKRFENKPPLFVVLLPHIMDKAYFEFIYSPK